MKRTTGIILAIAAALSFGTVMAQAPADSLLPPEVLDSGTESDSEIELDRPDEGQAELTREDVSAWLDGFMPYAIGQGNIPGATVSVVKDGEIFLSRGYGYADLENRTPVDPAETLFRAGSVSKLFIWTAVMQQVEQGRIDLDADINQYLDFTIPARDGDPITMANLMTHTAGFEEQLKDLLRQSPDEPLPYDELLKRWVPERVYPAGSTPAYSNYSTSLAGYIVERVTGEPLANYIEENIFAPLNMTDSTFRQPLPDRLASQMATGYESDGVTPFAFEIVGPWPAGSLSTTADDMARFMNAHLADGEGLMRPETAELMHAPLNRAIPGLNAMAHGFYQADINGRRVIAHGGDTVAFHSDLHLFLDEGVGLFVSMNAPGRQGASGAIRSILFEEFADRYFPPLQDETAAPVDASRAEGLAEALVGNYLTSRRSHSSFLDINGLLSQTEVTLDEDGNPVVSGVRGRGGAPAKFVPAGEGLWQEVGGHAMLGIVERDGEVNRFSMNGYAPIMVFDRVSFWRSAAWLNPALVVALIVLGLTAVLWPVRALTRRHFKAALPLEGRQLRAYRLSRIFAWAILLVLAGWAWFITYLFADVTNLSGSGDIFAFILQLASAIAFVGGFAAMVWYAVTVWRAALGWTGKLWSVLLALSALVVLYVGIAFNLIGLGASY
ncbi:serine hydrolase domain-containing protein [Qipengyuania sp. MTN3-11]|uniref:serine hydrolase domain-containing protein n=1 Tax=Qipengyuania sp. MTN3-11 TaxID=3056557 RepID=UPI0036F3D024